MAMPGRDDGGDLQIQRRLPFDRCQLDERAEPE
jgi:hypothetical protein